MKKFLMSISLLFFSTLIYAGEFVEIKVHGMTCGFCVDAVRRNLTKLPDVSKAEVSLKYKKVRVYPKTDSMDLKRVRQTIIDSGFTPIESKNKPSE